MIKTATSRLATNQAADNLFYYRNVTNRVQRVSVDQVMPQRFERVVFPGDRVLFYATPEAFLDVYTSTTAGLILVNRVPCTELQVYEKEI